MLSMKLTSYKCPICSSILLSTEGTTYNPNYGGLMVFCNNVKCPSQEVAGHSTTVEKAWEIVQQKFPVNKV